MPLQWNALKINLIIPLECFVNTGYNLQDHNVVNGLDFMVDAPITLSEANAQSPVYIMNYIMQGSGPYTIPGGAEGLAFVKTNGSTFRKFTSEVDSIYCQINLFEF